MKGLVRHNKTRGKLSLISERKREKERGRKVQKKRLLNQITGWLTYICNLYVIFTLIGVAFLIKYRDDISQMCLG